MGFGWRGKSSLGKCWSGIWSKVVVMWLVLWEGIWWGLWEKKRCEVGIWGGRRGVWRWERGRVQWFWGTGEERRPFHHSMWGVRIKAFCQISLSLALSVFLTDQCVCDNFRPFCPHLHSAFQSFFSFSFFIFFFFC